MDSTIYVEDADLQRPEHAASVLHLLEQYSLDPFGAAEQLSDAARQQVVEELRQRSPLICLARRDGVHVGLAICLTSFSTFLARPILNLHDFAVLPGHRGSGVGRALMHHLLVRAKELGFPKVTLEVREDNVRAQSLYRSMGFRPDSGGHGMKTEYWVTEFE